MCCCLSVLRPLIGDLAAGFKPVPTKLIRLDDAARPMQQPSRLPQTVEIASLGGALVPANRLLSPTNPLQQLGRLPQGVGVAGLGVSLQPPMGSSVRPAPSDSWVPFLRASGSPALTARS